MNYVLIKKTKHDLITMKKKYECRWMGTKLLHNDDIHAKRKHFLIN